MKSPLLHFELLPYELVKTLYSLGFDTPTPVQQQTIPLLSNKENFLATAPTGSGKTGAFAIGAYLNINIQSPILQCIIISPTRELCVQTAEQVNLITNLRVGSCAGAEDYKKVRNQIQKNQIQILVATLAKLRLLLSDIKLAAIRLVIVDEADSIISRPDFEELAQSLRFCDLKYGLFSATFSQESKEAATKLLSITRVVDIRLEKCSNALIKHFVYRTNSATDKPGLLIELLHRLSFVQAIVFTNSLQVSNQLFSSLRSKFSCTVLNSKLDVTTRLANAKTFQSGLARVLIATDIFGRGMDVRSATLVVNYDVPDEREEFLHRAGRAGRFGREGTVVSLEEDGEGRVGRWLGEEGRTWEVV